MMGVRDAQMLARYNAWADKLLHAAVAALPEAEVVKPRKSVFKQVGIRSPDDKGAAPKKYRVRISLREMNSSRGA